LKYKELLAARGFETGFTPGFTDYLFMVHPTKPYLRWKKYRKTMDM